MSDTELDDEARSEDSIHVVLITKSDIDRDEDGKFIGISYLCEDSDGAEEWVCRSDLMDGGTHQKLVRVFDRKNPLPWDQVCSFCDGEGCEECECPECDRKCRHIEGVNFGCEKHPVI